MELDDRALLLTRRQLDVSLRSKRITRYGVQLGPFASIEGTVEAIHEWAIRQSGGRDRTFLDRAIRRPTCAEYLYCSP